MSRRPSATYSDRRCSSKWKPSLSSPAPMPCWGTAGTGHRQRSAKNATNGAFGARTRRNSGKLRNGFWPKYLKTRKSTVAC